MNKNKGFTLIELLVVVLIIGILAGIAIPNYLRTMSQSRVTEALVITKNIVDAENRFRALSNDDSYTAAFQNLDLTFIHERGESEGQSLAGQRVTGDTYFTKQYTYTLANDRVIACPVLDTGCEIVYLFDVNINMNPISCVDGARFNGLCASLGLPVSNNSVCGTVEEVNGEGD